jgi:hypothetical protein
MTRLRETLPPVVSVVGSRRPNVVNPTSSERP